MLNLATYNNSPDHSTKGTTSHLNVLCVLVNTRFQVLFHSPPGVLFTFPSQYFFTIGHQVVFRLGGWAPRIPYRFHVSVGTLDTGHFLRISSTRLSLSLVELPNSLDYPLKCFYRSEPQAYCYSWFGLFRFRSPLLAKSRCWFLFLSLLRCFSSGGSPHAPMYSVHDIRFFTVCVSTFRNLRVVRLFAANRSLSQLVTSFFGSWCQGILLVLLFAWTSFASICLSTYVGLLVLS